MKKHPFDPLSFAGGVVFLLIAGTAALGSDFDVTVEVWVLPSALLILGAGILAASVRGLRAGREGAPLIDMDSADPDEEA